MIRGTVRRVCLVSHNPYSRDTRVRKYADALMEAGATVHVLCPRGLIDRGRDEAVQVMSIPLQRSYGGHLSYIAEYAISLFFYTVYLAALHLRFRYAVIQFHNGPDCIILAGLLPRLLGAKLVLDIRDPMPELYRAKFGGAAHSRLQRILRWVERGSCRLAHVVLTANHLFKDALVGRGLPESKITVITNAPERGLFSRDRVVETPRDGFVLLYTGTVAPRYGLDVAIRAVASLAPELPDLRLRIIGPLTRYTEFLADLARVVGIPDRVEFVPAIHYQRVPIEIASAHVGIYPAILTPHTDIATPCKVLEYVAMGIPVVASRLRILQELFGEDALAYFEPENDRDMANRIKELHDDPALAVQLVRNADASVRTAGDSWEVQSRIYTDLLGSLLADTRARLSPERQTMGEP
jgi:glycosyltransferase involved in cell wall biosynthesis